MLMSKGATRLAAEERRGLIVDIALELLAREGLEGLRTRSVAAAAEINTATLHHYFPTKEDLIAAIALRLEERLRTEHAPRRREDAGVDEALLALRRQFADVAFYVRRRPELVAVYRELVVRAARDEPTRALVERVNAGWKRSVGAIVRRGRDAGTFRADCDPAAVADLVVAASWGFLALLQLSPAAYRRSCLEIERGLLAPSHPEPMKGQSR
jgi:AcrR family transcriptional regulator